MGYLEDSAADMVANGTINNPNFSMLDFSSVIMVIVTVLSFVLPVILIYPPVPVTQSDALKVSHSKIGVQDPSKSALRTQYDKANPNAKPRIHSLWIYPIKSCAGIELTRSKVLPTGLQYDRMFIFAQLTSPFPVGVDASKREKSEHSWHMITMRQFPSMATVKVDLWVPDEAKLRGKLNSEDRPTESYLVVRFPWQDKGWRGLMQLISAKLRGGRSAEPEKEILLPIEFPSKGHIEAKGYEMEKVRVWEETVKALNMQRELPIELQKYLGVSNRLGLFRVDPNNLREVFRNAPKKKDAGYQPTVGFQDAYPLNILSLSSLQDLASKVPKDETMRHVDIRRFRSNVIFSGSPAYDEETWRRIYIAPENSEAVTRASFDVCCRCVRCTLPNIDPDTGRRHKTEPNRTLRKTRDVDEGAPNLGCMAMQMVPLFRPSKAGKLKPEDMESWLEVGMPIQVEERGEHLYIPMQ